MNHRNSMIDEQPPNVYNNPATIFDEELNRRFTQYTPEPTLQRETQKIQSNKGTINSQK